MSVRELVVLGTASQVPTQDRNHNGYLLRWDGEGFLFDPGEGTQRQLTLAGVPASQITRICITHLHGDHCFGLPGVLQRLEMDRVQHAVDLWFPESGAVYVERLRGAVIGRADVQLRTHPADEGLLADTGSLRLLARRLDHRVDALGYRLEEPDGVRMVPERLEALGVRGSDIGRLQAAGSVEVAGRRVRLEEVSEPRPGQVFSFVMDTRVCEAALALAEGADLLVIESTFLSEHAALAQEYGHLTAAQAGTIAAEAGVRRLVLTHFSQRYPDVGAQARAEAAGVFDGDIVVAEDLMRVPVPPRRRAASDEVPVVEP
jgi:ribonuclease Z